MNKIEKIQKPTTKEKLLLKLKNFVGTRAIAYGVSAVGGVVVGHSIQNVERGITGYDPKEHELLRSELKKENLTDFDSFKKDRETEKRRSLLKWFSSLSEKLKQSKASPKEFVKTLDTYKELKLKLLDYAKVIDDAAFLAPALLIFIMLGGYLARKTEELRGGPVAKHERNLILNKINELVDSVNEVMAAIDKNGADSLSQDELAHVRAMLRSHITALPDAEDI